MDRATGILADGLGAAASNSGILTQQQARIFGLLYLSERPLSLDEIAAELSQSKSNVSINVRVLVEWHLVRRRTLPGSRRDHYEAASDFFRAMQEIFERRFARLRPDNFVHGLLAECLAFHIWRLRPIR